MSRLEVPLQHRTLRTTGDTVLWADLVLSLKTDSGAWEEISFRVDPGTEMTTMLAFEARKLALPIPKKPVSRPGAARPRGACRCSLRAPIVGMDLIEFIFPLLLCRRPRRSSRGQARNLLGLTGVINQIRLTFDGKYSLLCRTGLPHRREAVSERSTEVGIEPPPSCGDRILSRRLSKPRCRNSVLARRRSSRIAVYRPPGKTFPRRGPCALRRLVVPNSAVGAS